VNIKQNQRKTHNNAIISKSDKGNSIVIIHQETYEKVMDFIHKNKFTNTTGDRTKKFQK
jgi:hypothetical protein